ncbi:MAG: SRPBCC family protein [Micropepsaceae bacterium]
MTKVLDLDAWGIVSEPATLKIQRLLPGPIERVWAYLTDSNLRRQWLAAGQMEAKSGTPFELTWRNDELTDPPGVRPTGISAEHSMQSRIIEFDPPRKLVFTWSNSGDVLFELEPQGTDVLLTVIHRRLPDRSTQLAVSAGWHMHLDLLVARVSNTRAEPFWDGWVRLRAAYEQRLKV